MNIHINDSIDSIVSKNLKAAKVLNRHGIDYSSEGGKSLREACREVNISFRKLQCEIRKAEVHRRAAPADVTSLEIDKLTRFIETYHHLYTYENINFIKNNIERLVRIYGKRFQELEKINRVFIEMTTHLTVHMRHEEFILFPYIRKMASKGKKVRSSIFKSVQSPISDMVTDHEMESECLKKLNMLTHHYAVPDESDNAFRVTYEALRELEQDIHDHLRIENEILFPKALEMEGRFNTTASWKHRLTEVSS